MAWDGDSCASVQERMARSVAAQLTRTRVRIAELTRLAEQRQAATERLIHTAGGGVRPGLRLFGCGC